MKNKEFKKRFMQFLGKEIKHEDIYKCVTKVKEIRILFCEGRESEKELKDIEFYFSVLLDIYLNEKRAFDDSVNRLKRYHG